MDWEETFLFLLNRRDRETNPELLRERQRPAEAEQFIGLIRSSDANCFPSGPLGKQFALELKARIQRGAQGACAHPYLRQIL